MSQPEIWLDLDGTVFDVRARFLHAHALVLTGLGVNTVPGDTYQWRCEGLTSREILERLQLGHLLESYAPAFRAAVEHPKLLELDTLRPHAGECVARLGATGALYALSGRDDPSRLAEQLERFSLRGHFKEVVTVPSHWKPDDKAAVLSARKGAVAYVGDTPKDVGAARLARSKAFGLLGGMSTDERLRGTGCPALANDWPALCAALLAWLATAPDTAG